MKEFEPAQSRKEAILQNLLGAVNELEPPQSRVEKILMNMLGENYELEPPQSRIEALLLQLLEQGSSGGGGTDLAAADVYVADYLSAADLTITLGAINRYQRFIVGG